MAEQQRGASEAAAETRAAPSPSRVIIEGVAPEIDCGAFPIKRTVGEPVEVAADLFAEGHDLLAARVKYRRVDHPSWQEVPMAPVAPGTDRWSGTFVPETQGRYVYTVEAWVDRFASWRREVARKHEAGLELASELLEGAAVVRLGSNRAAAQGQTADAAWLSERAEFLAGAGPAAGRVAAGLDPELSERMARYPDRRGSATYPRSLEVMVERVKARFSAWYEIVPEIGSLGGRPPRDLRRRDPPVALRGQDGLRRLVPSPDSSDRPRVSQRAEQLADRRAGRPGKSLGDRKRRGRPHRDSPRTGQLRGLRPACGRGPPPRDRNRAGHRVSGVARPSVGEGASRVVPPPARRHDQVRRESSQKIPGYLSDPLRMRGLEAAVAGAAGYLPVLDRSGRLDLPGGQPAHQAVPVLGLGDPRGLGPPSRHHFPVRGVHPAEAVEAPGQRGLLAVVQLLHLAEHQGRADRVFHRTDDVRVGRVSQAEPVREHTRYPSRIFASRRAARVPDPPGPRRDPGGIVWDLRSPVRAGRGDPVRPGSEEYLNSEKYQIRHWDRAHPDSLRDFIARINAIRRENPALQSDRSLRFFPIDNEQMICYGKTSPDRTNLIVVVVTLDPRYAQSGFVTLPARELGLGDSFQVHDLISDARYSWNEGRNYVRLDPHICPAHIFRVRQRIRSEHDFDYYL